MLDKSLTPLAHKLLKPLVIALDKLAIKPDQVTLTGFFIGILAVPFLAMQWWIPALVAIIFNRILDGIDGELARLQQSQSDAGGFLDICLDFLFYSAVPFGFVLADTPNNGVAGAALILAFVGTGSSFLAFAIMAEKHKIERLQFQNKSFHYLTGLTEGTETIAFFILICLFPPYFPILAWLFVAACLVTILTRIGGGYKTLRDTHV